MSRAKHFLLSALFLAGCGSHSTSAVPPTQPEVPGIAPPTSTSTVEAPGEPVIIDFGGKAVYTQLHDDDMETGELLPGFTFSEYGDATVTGDPNQVVGGEYSVRLSRYGHMETNPDLLPLIGGVTYLIEFDYRIIDRVSDDEDTMYFFFYPAGSSSENQDLRIGTFSMLGNADAQGSFTLGGKMGGAHKYILSINASEMASVVIDNLQVLRQDVRILEEQPEHWGELSSLPYPRLGSYMLGTSNWIAYGIGGEPPFSYSVNQIERRMAMVDVLVGTEIRSQTIDPGFTYRLRKLNPNIVILPYRIAQEEEIVFPLSPLWEDATEDIVYEFQLGLADEWFVEDTSGNHVGDPDWVEIHKMNISEQCPVINGKKYIDYLIDWVLDDVMANGHWDGIYFDNLFGKINPHIPNRWDPAALDFDINRNGERDETPAMVSEITRSAATYLLERLRGEVGDLEIIIGNTGPHPEIHLAPFVNGYLFECVNEAWDSEWLPDVSEPGWRLILQEYDIMQAQNVSPVINIFEGCGRTGDFVEPDQVYIEPTEGDMQNHRFTLGTALLGDGFYEYDLYDGRSAPYWFDEYTVNPQGVAEEAPENKGYLGQALGEAVELKSPAKSIWQEDFELRVMPAGLKSNSGVYVSQEPTEVVDGSASLVLDNPNHSRRGFISTSTHPNMVAFTSGETYVVEFDWRILDTLDESLVVYVWDGRTDVPGYRIPGEVTGDSGSAIFTTTLGPGVDWRLAFDLIGGGGKVAIDNIKITRGGAGPWRRDFENGFVLVNPLNKPYTFTLEELSSDLGRTGIKRILGTQAPEINNGQVVVESLTLQPFDAIILLADHIPQQ